MAERGKLKFEIIEKFGILSTSKSGWNLELNLVQWGDNQPKFDLRSWSPDHNKMGKGVGLTHDELKQLQQVLQNVLGSENKNLVTNFTPHSEVSNFEADDDFENDRPQVTRLSD
ncbi:YdbC family protein [Weissella koreensis]|uniref:Transcriptional coactivator p15 (PC4) C-terminal domain-containing protein n=1 Tax=Weissella koreensis TaxID=165096 RepID=A0A7H1MM27_9LACO|nr:PC4/YdbC family ssDNA-binding protein [Weissella koreensis]AVH75309.1 hypothetical protein C4597_04440 [Weissella koreensis]EJF34807.1 hypothetical protein JC2156_11190 [Weissella koreensis KCTC 3621]QGN20535.1 hypothetical protein GKC51_04425 [Weissella koreensis]QNT64513.1 hypothetical protein FY536_04155 [Weissella koreensis]